MSAYIAQLNAAVFREQAQRAETDRAAIKAARERLTPLEERLTRLLATIHPRRALAGLAASFVAGALARQLSSGRIRCGAAQPRV
jgi:hypothetical protein